MKKKVSVRELKEYVTYKKPNNIIFQTENQDWYKAADPCKLRMSFPIMLINENPNLICLKAGANTLSIDRVKCVEIDSNLTTLGDVLKVFCGDFKSDTFDTTYTLIVS